MEGVVGSNSGNGTIKFLYSYGGRIQPRSTDGKLRYVGGHTRVLTVGRSISLAELLVKFGESCGSSVSLRCQLPTEDLDTLVSVTGDDDLANLIEEYDLAAASASPSSRYSPIKIRAILSPPKSLKSVSSPPSAANSTVAPGKSPLGGPRRSSSSPYTKPIGVRRDAIRECFHPCCAHGNPNPLYLVPFWNKRH